MAPSGTLRASANDVGRFLGAMLSEGLAPDGTRVISEAALRETWVSQIDRTPEPYQDAHGSSLGWSTVTYQGVEMLSKDGNLGGFAAQMSFVPEADIGVVVLTNTDFGGLLGRGVQYRFIELALGLDAEIEMHVDGERVKLGEFGQMVEQLSPVESAAVTPYLGSYDIGVGDLYTLSLDDDRLWLSMGQLDFIELVAAPDGSYVAISGGDFLLMSFEFMTNEEGDRTMVMAGQVVLPKVD